MHRLFQCTDFSSSYKMPWKFYLRSVHDTPCHHLSFACSSAKTIAAKTIDRPNNLTTIILVVIQSIVKLKVILFCGNGFLARLFSNFFSHYFLYQLLTTSTHIIHEIKKVEFIITFFLTSRSFLCTTLGPIFLLNFFKDCILFCAELL